jgi:hypothetical protein
MLNLAHGSMPKKNAPAQAPALHRCPQRLFLSEADPA